ncbi:hypothetical protein Plhal710r2_c006g0026061 [Plasmopara halstedii]
MRCEHPQHTSLQPSRPPNRLLHVSAHSRERPSSLKLASATRCGIVYNVAESLSSYFLSPYASASESQL